MFNPSNFKGEFVNVHPTKNLFRLVERPMYNKKMRRHLGLSKDPIRRVVTAQGYLGKKYIVRTRPVVVQEIESNGEYLRFSVEGGDWYRAKIALHLLTKGSNTGDDHV